MKKKRNENSWKFCCKSLNDPHGNHKVLTLLHTGGLEVTLVFLSTHLLLVEVWQDEAASCLQLRLGVFFVIRARLHVLCLRKTWKTTIDLQPLAAAARVSLFRRRLPHPPLRRCWTCWSAGRSRTRRSAWRRSPWRGRRCGAAARESGPHRRTARAGRCRCRRCCTRRPAELRTQNGR